MRGVQVAAESGVRNRCALCRVRDDRDRGEVLLRWRLANPPGLGRLRLPSIELAATPSTGARLAISSDPHLECEIVDATGLKAETANEFLTLWGHDEGRDTPQLVLGNVASANELIVAVRPRTAESSIDEVLHVAAGEDELRVQYQADVVPGPAHQFQYSMIVPADLAVDRVSVMQAGRPIDVRWSRPSAEARERLLCEDLADPYRLDTCGACAGSRRG